MTCAEFGGLQITGGTTVVHVLSTGTELSGTIATWAAIAAGTHGAGSVSASTTTGRLTLLPGTYKIDVDLSIENAAVSGLSSEDVTVQDVIQAQLYKGGGAGNVPAAIAGTKSQTEVMEGLIQFLHISAIVEVSKADQDASNNFVSIFLSTALAGGSASDILVKEARLLAVRLD